MDSLETPVSLALHRQQTVLARFGELALRSNDLDEILTESCRLVGEALGTDLAKVVELAADGRTLHVRAGVGWKPGVVGIVSIDAADNTLENEALKTGEPMISSDIAAETRFTYPSFLVDNGVRAVANVMIIGDTGQPPFGILEVDSRHPRIFDASDTAFLRSYANLIAAAVTRLRLHQGLVARKAKLRLAYQALEAKTAELTETNARLMAEAEERTRIEEALHQSQKMEAVGQLTGGLAHDFNNMLTGISGSLELMRLRLSQGRTVELDRYIDSAMASTNRAAALTHRLLAFSRRQTLDPRVTDMNRLVRGMEDLLRRTVSLSIDIEIRLVDGLWLTLCDPNQIENTLLNLVINARDAMPDGGRLTIETSNAERMVPGDCVGLFVTDTGAGMSPTVQSRAFDPFFTTKPIGVGTGLGLSMIHGFVRQSGGDVHLCSAEGEGTTVAVYLPRFAGTMTTDGEPPDIAAEAAVASQTSDVILIVEDEVAILEIVSELLGDLGYTVLRAETGPSGLAVLDSKKRIDLLITDVGLPGGVNGRQLADAARRQRPGLKVLFITGYAEGALVEKGVLEHGMQVITKPFPVNALTARVQGMLNG